MIWTLGPHVQAGRCGPLRLDELLPEVYTLCRYCRPRNAPAQRQIDLQVIPVLAFPPGVHAKCLETGIITLAVEGHESEHGQPAAQELVCITQDHGMV